MQESWEKARGQVKSEFVRANLALLEREESGTQWTTQWIGSMGVHVVYVEATIAGRFGVQPSLSRDPISGNGKTAASTRVKIRSRAEWHEPRC